MVNRATLTFPSLARWAPSSPASRRGSYESCPSPAKRERERPDAKRREGEGKLRTCGIDRSAASRLAAEVLAGRANKPAGYGSAFNECRACNRPGHRATVAAQG